MESDSFHWCPGTGHEAVSTNRDAESSLWTSGNNFLSIRMTKIWNKLSWVLEFTTPGLLTNDMVLVSSSWHCNSRDWTKWCQRSFPTLSDCASVLVFIVTTFPKFLFQLGLGLGIISHWIWAEIIKSMIKTFYSSVSKLSKTEITLNCFYSWLWLQLGPILFE